MTHCRQKRMRMWMRMGMRMFWGGGIAAGKFACVMRVSECDTQRVPPAPPANSGWAGLYGYTGICVSNGIASGWMIGQMNGLQTDACPCERTQDDHIRIATSTTTCTSKGRSCSWNSNGSSPRGLLVKCLRSLRGHHSWGDLNVMRHWKKCISNNLLSKAKSKLKCFYWKNIVIYFVQYNLPSIHFWEHIRRCKDQSISGRLKNTSFCTYLNSPKIFRSNLFHFKEKNICF